MQTELTLTTSGPGLYEITQHLRDWVGAQDRDGAALLTLLVQHTSCSLLIQENADPDVQTDLAGFFARLVPPGDDPSMRWLTHVMEGPDDMPAHIKAALLPVSLSIPVRDGTLRLGTWQGVYVMEHRSAPHQRRIVAHLA